MTIRVKTNREVEPIKYIGMGSFDRKMGLFCMEMQGSLDGMKRLV